MHTNLIDVRVVESNRFMNQSVPEKIFEELFTLYGDAIFRFCMVKVSNVELAEDMTQEVFMRYWGYLSAGKEIQNPRALLYTIANNLAKDWYKKKKADSLDDQIALGYDPIEKSPGPQLQAEHQEILTALDELAENDKEIMVMRYVDGLEPRDIATILNESANVISVRLNRATKRLQTILHI